LSYGFFAAWKFCSDPGISGHTSEFPDGIKFRAIGVTGSSFSFGTEVGTSYDLAFPLCAEQLLANDKKGDVVPDWPPLVLSIIGRVLKPGGSIQAATAHLPRLFPQVSCGHACSPNTSPDMAETVP